MDGVFMNAYKLADELENYVWMNPNNNRDYCKEVKDMLRQQADLIRNLQKSLGFKNSGYETINLTPQTKPLSDEEIWNWFKENTALTKESALRIARAIEERHGIK
jgi:hypothetical protein